MYVYSMCVCVCVCVSRDSVAACYRRTARGSISGGEVFPQ